MDREGLSIERRKMDLLDCGDLVSRNSFIKSRPRFEVEVITDSVCNALAFGV